MIIEKNYEKELSKRLGTARMKTVHYFDTVDSTNLRLRELAKAGAEEGTVVIAANQSNGRGRLGRSFDSPDGGIYMSWLMRPDCPPEDVMNITAWVSVAVVNAIDRVYGFRAGIKWVNDLVAGSRKICGILTEISASEKKTDYMIVGIGVNVNNESFPEELRDKAVSLYMETGERKPRAELAAAVIEELDVLYRRWPADKQAYLEAYRRDNITIGRDVTLVSGERIRPAFTEGIDDDFALVVRLKDGSVEHISSGDVSVRGIYGEK